MARLTRCVFSLAAGRSHSLNERIALIAYKNPDIFAKLVAKLLEIQMNRGNIGDENLREVGVLGQDEYTGEIDRGNEK